MAEPGGGELVVDTGPLSHLAEAGWLSVLRSVAGDRKVIIPDTVDAELRQGLHLKPHLQPVLDAAWITTRPLVSEAELTAFAHFAARLVVGERNLGEAGVLAYARANGAIAVIDDRVARQAAIESGVSLRPTLALLCQAIREDLLTVRMVGDVADHLIETEYRLPFKRGGFLVWADENGVVSANDGTASTGESRAT